MTADTYLAERERLSAITAGLERLEPHLAALERALAAHAEAVDAREDWRAVAVAGIAPMPEGETDAPRDALFDLGYIAAGNVARIGADLARHCRGPADESLRRYTAGLRLLASEVQRAATSDHDLDSQRVDAICHGLRIVGARIVEQGQREASHAIDAHGHRVADLRGCGLSDAAERLETDPELAACLRVLERAASAWSESAQLY